MRAQGFICRALEVAFAVMLLSATAAGTEHSSLARYRSEAEAAEAGLRLGIGSATLEGPEKVEVLTHQRWTLVYTAGKAGIRPGGGIRIAMRHSLCWSAPQTKNPKGDGYLTVKTTGEVPARTYIEYNTFKGRFFHQYHPWQNIVEVTLPEGLLAAGETIRVTYGDRSGGSRGIRIQPFDESPFMFKVYVDPLGNDDYLPLTENPAIDIVAAEPHRLGVVVPSDAVIGKPTWCAVRADGHNMGSEYETGAPPTIRIHAVGTAPITRIEIKKDSEIVHTQKPNRISVDLQWRDPGFKPDRECYYYIRLVQADHEEAISSPIWVN